MLAGKAESIERKLRRYLAERELDEGLPEDADPLAADAVDSLGLEQLVEYVRSEYGVTIGSEEMVRENLGSLAALAALIESRLV